MSPKSGEMNAIWKLLNIVLLLFLFVLIIYGVTTKGLNPSIKEITMKFNEVRGLFGTSGFHNDCYSSSILDVYGGESFLTKIDGVGSVSTLKICKDGTCEFNSSNFGAYRLKDDVFYKIDNGRSIKDDVQFHGNLTLIKANWKLYNGALNFLESINYQPGFHPVATGFLGKPKNTRKFVLYGDGIGFGGDVVAVWQNNIWQIKRGPKTAKNGRKLVYIGNNDTVALQIFYKIVTAGMDDNVYWKILAPDENYNEKVDEGSPVGTFVETQSWTELDSDKKLDELMTKFGIEKSKLLSEINPSLSEVHSLKLDGRTVTISGIKFVVKMYYLANGGIVIGFISNSKKFGMKYSPYGKSEVSVPGGKYSALRISSFALVKFSNSWVPMGDENYYKLYKRDFMEEYRGTLIKKFLRDKCK